MEWSGLDLDLARLCTTVLCSLAILFTFTVPLSTQDYKWVASKLSEKPEEYINTGSEPYNDRCPTQGRKVVVLPAVPLCYRNIYFDIMERDVKCTKQ